MRLAALVAVAASLAPAASAAAVPVHVATSLTPSWLFFADAVTANVDVTYDPRIVSGDSVRIETALAPWEQIGSVHVSTTETATSGHRAWRFVVACLSIDCLTRGTAVQRFHLPAVRVEATTRSGTPIAARRSWPTLRIAGRFRPATTSGLRPVFKLDTALPAATYGTDPSVLSLTLVAIGALLGTIGVAVLALAAFRWRSSRRVPPVIPPLARALALLREAQGRDPDDRRRAAGLVARTLPADADGLTSRATKIAWSPSQPAADELAELAQDLESRVERSE
jgi:hypothetical protein